MRLSTSLVDSSAHIQQHCDGLRAKVGGQVVPPPKGIRYIKGERGKGKAKKEKRRRMKEKERKSQGGRGSSCLFLLFIFFFFLLGTSVEMRSGTDGCESYKERPRSFSPVKK
jgi:hypothetical protein